MPFSIVHQRLHAQGLLGQKFKSPREAVKALGAVQGQEYAPAKWALGLRVKGIHEDDVEHAFIDGEILRTHVMRPTWHFVAPEDIRWMQMLTGPRVKKILGHYDRKMGLDHVFLEKALSVVERALKGENFLTRKEIGAALAKKGLACAGQKLAHVSAHAELDALICSGPRKGKQFTYALVEERAPKAKEFSREKALEELVARYFTSHGPATIPDFTWWSGMTVADTKEGLNRAKSLKSETIEGHTYWFSKEAKVGKFDSPLMHFLPIYDEYTIAYKNRSAFFPANVPKSKNPREMVAFNHAIIRDGKIIGMWKRTLGKTHIDITTNLFTPLEKNEQRALQDAADAFGTFWELPVRLKTK